MSRHGIEMLTLLGMPPVEYVSLAGELGCREVSSGLSGLPLSMFGLDDVFYPEWSLRDDAELRREMKVAMRDTGVSIGLGEGFRVAPDCKPADFAGDLDLMAELGALRINAICMDDEMVASGAAKDELAELAEMALARDMGFTMEFFPPTGLNCIERALEVVDHIGAGKARLLIDTMHFFRTGGTVEKLRALDPALIGYVQLADSPAGPPEEEYFSMAMFARMVPGEGELPLAELIAALPADVTISCEVPRLEDLRGGMAPRDHAARCLAAARALGA
ncbi:MAG: sugar phosphate isomerase/epimerase [Novosphingobium sp.]|nr:sugar phosphate isomerase/epimerase [Novosphingobium sp.]MCP5403909.1 sugar phosphate isomerase/epimerase [Novosphingobium sp.]